MNKLCKPISATVLLLAGTALNASCSRSVTLDETAYVAPANLKLRSSTAQISNIVGELKGGDRITIVGRSYSVDGKLWVKVKSPKADSGWAEARYFVSAKVVEESRRIAERIKDNQTQAIGRSKATLKLRLTPDRTDDENVATTLPQGTILEVVGRERKPKPATAVIEDEGNPEASKAAARPFDDWLLVRLKDYVVLPAGWIYGASVELEIPGDIIYFASTGRRIMGWQKLGTVKEENGRSGDHYLVLERMISGADEHVDFDRVKVLAYDPAARDYITPFREELSGKFPVSLKMEGTRGQFKVPVISKDNQSKLVTYDVEILANGSVVVTRKK
jgi:Bacterial SH3 domain